ncbi:hypothetical protein ABT340_36725 [Streptosporangium sp. NPDC000239]|uniref:hypothetical protein n=1 Tax=Streptosporangium sp. NPDC000239 TaxID=3154248 RepID=UPI0033211ACE
MKEAARGRVVEAGAHENDSAEGVDRTLFATQPAVPHRVDGVLGAWNAVFGLFEVSVDAGGEHAGVGGGDDVAVQVGQLEGDLAGGELDGAQVSGDAFDVAGPGTVSLGDPDGFVTFKKSRVVMKSYSSDFKAKTVSELLRPGRSSGPVMSSTVPTATSGSPTNCVPGVTGQRTRRGKHAMEPDT